MDLNRLFSACRVHGVKQPIGPYERAKGEEVFENVQVRKLHENAIRITFPDKRSAEYATFTTQLLHDDGLTDSDYDVHYLSSQMIMIDNHIMRVESLQQHTLPGATDKALNLVLAPNRASEGTLVSSESDVHYGVEIVLEDLKWPRHDQVTHDDNKWTWRYNNGSTNSWYDRLCFENEYYNITHVDAKSASIINEQRMDWKNYYDVTITVADIDNRLQAKTYSNRVYPLSLIRACLFQHQVPYSISDTVSVRHVRLFNGTGFEQYLTTNQPDPEFGEVMRRIKHNTSRGDTQLLGSG